MAWQQTDFTVNMPWVPLRESIAISTTLSMIAAGLPKQRISAAGRRIDAKQYQGSRENLHIFKRFAIFFIQPKGDVDIKGGDAGRPIDCS
jgi:hypothetical protein